jgi:hypothetical protein
MAWGARNSISTQVGAACEDGCAADDEGNTCSNRGTCVDAGAGVASCACDAGFGGKACELECGGCSNHGGCVYDDDTGSRCNCDGDHAGAECEFDCPSLCGNQPVRRVHDSSLSHFLAMT